MLTGGTNWDQMLAARGNLALGVWRIVNGSYTSALPWVRRITSTRELSGDVPSEVSLVAGAVSTSVRLDVDLGEPTAPLPYVVADRDAWLGQRMQIDAAYDYPNADPIPVIRGRLRQMGFRENDGERTGVYTVQEDNGAMRTPVTLAPFGSTAERMVGDKVIRYPTNLSALVAVALNAGPRPVTPPPIPSAHIAVPLAGGMLATAGWTVPKGPGYAAGTKWLRDGLFTEVISDKPSCPMPSLGSTYACAYPARPWPTSPDMTRVQFWCRAVPNGGALVEALALEMGGAALVINLDSTSVRTQLYTAAGDIIDGPSATLSGQNTRMVTVDFSHSNGFTRVNVGGLFEPWTSATTAAAPGGNNMYLRLSGGQIQAVSARSFSSGEQRPDLPTYGSFWDAGSRVEASTLDVDMMPGVDGRPAWDLAKEVAAAELALLGFNEWGRGEFRSRATVNDNRDPVAEWDTDLIDGLSGAVSTDSIRNRVTAIVKRSWFLGSGRGAETPASTAVPAYLHGAVLTLPSGTSEHLLSGTLPFAPVSSRVTIITAMGEAWDVDNGMAVCGTNTGGSLYTGTAVTATLHPVSSTSWKLVVANGSGSTKYAVWPSSWTGSTPFKLEPGQGAVWINGLAVVADVSTSETTVTREVGTMPEAERSTLALPSNPWRQDVASVTALCTRLVSDLRRARLELQDVTIPGDPRYQVGDVIKLKDFAGRVPDLLVRIVRKVDTYGDRVPLGMSTTVSLRSLAPSTSGLYGDGAYGSGPYGA